MARSGRSRGRARVLSGHSSPRKIKNHRVLCVTAYELGAALRNANKNIKKAHNLISYYDTLFWEPIDNAPSAALFVDRLFSGARNLARQSCDSHLLARDARTIENILETLDDSKISALFAPYIKIIKQRADGDTAPHIHQAMLAESEAELDWGDEA